MRAKARLKKSLVAALEALRYPKAKAAGGGARSTPAAQRLNVVPFPNHAFPEASTGRTENQPQERNQRQRQRTGVSAPYGQGQRAGRLLYMVLIWVVPFQNLGRTKTLDTLCHSCKQGITQFLVTHCWPVHCPGSPKPGPLKVCPRGSKRLHPSQTSCL
jgi:hypothetical protein